MNSLVKVFLIFLSLTGVAAILSNFSEIEFGSVSYWDKHGYFFLFFITLFPRLTLLFSSVAFGGILWWLCFFIAPRFLIACLASMAYWETNPILVIIAWSVCLSGESGEKYIVSEKVKNYKQSGQVFEAEFTRKE
jgi:hypothetical protein